ncbi:hypothetical protein UlMin_015649 [Ulmus minor]
MASRHNFQYSSLPTYENYGNGRQFDCRFEYTPKSFDKVPWKSIALAFFLLFLGSVLLFLSYFEIPWKSFEIVFQNMGEVQMVFWSWKKKNKKKERKKNEEEKEREKKNN